MPRHYPHGILFVLLPTMAAMGTGAAAMGPTPLALVVSVLLVLTLAFAVLRLYHVAAKWFA